LRLRRARQGRRRWCRGLHLAGSRSALGAHPRAHRFDPGPGLHRFASRDQCLAGKSI